MEAVAVERVLKFRPTCSLLPNYYCGAADMSNPPVEVASTSATNEHENEHELPAPILGNSELLPADGGRQAHLTLLACSSLCRSNTSRQWSEAEVGPVLLLTTSHKR